MFQVPSNTPVQTTARPTPGAGKPAVNQNFTVSVPRATPLPQGAPVTTVTPADKAAADRALGNVNVPGPAGGGSGQVIIEGQGALRDRAIERAQEQNIQVIQRPTIQRQTPQRDFSQPSGFIERARQNNLENVQRVQTGYNPNRSSPFDFPGDVYKSVVRLREGKNTRSELDKISPIDREILLFRASRASERVGSGTLTGIFERNVPGFGLLGVRELDPIRGAQEAAVAPYFIERGYSTEESLGLARAFRERNIVTGEAGAATTFIAANIGSEGVGRFALSKLFSNRISNTVALSGGSLTRKEAAKAIGVPSFISAGIGGAIEAPVTTVAIARARGENVTPLNLGLQTVIGAGSAGLISSFISQGSIRFPAVAEFGQGVINVVDPFELTGDAGFSLIGKRVGNDFGVSIPILDGARPARVSSKTPLFAQFNFFGDSNPFSNASTPFSQPTKPVQPSRDRVVNLSNAVTPIQSSRTPFQIPIFPNLTNRPSQPIIPSDPITNQPNPPIIPPTDIPDDPIVPIYFPQVFSETPTNPVRANVSTNIITGLPPMLPLLPGFGGSGKSGDIFKTDFFNQFEFARRIAGRLF